MSKTNILWLCLYFGGISASFVKGPLYGLLNYMFTFYTQFTWIDRDLRLERWSLYASIAMLASYLLYKGREEKLSHFKMPQMKWLILFLFNMILVSPFAVDPDGNNKIIIDFVKLVTLYYLIVCIVRTKKHYKMFLWLQLWGNYLFGWQSHGKKLQGGRLEGVGGPATSTSNSLANHMIMILPFLNNFFFFGNKWERIAAIYATPWILNVLILCNSRGAFLAILAICIIALVRAEKNVRKKMLVGIILAGIMFVYLADARFWERMNTIGDDNQEGSGRMETWLGAIELIKDHPFGVGGKGFEYLSPVYIPEIVYAHRGEERSVHNSYLAVATNYGIQGILIYSFFIASTLLELHRVRKRSGLDNDFFYFIESSAIEISIWGFLIAATFGARPYLETFYWYCALGSALSNMQQSEIKDKLNVSELKLHNFRQDETRAINQKEV